MYERTYVLRPLGPGKLYRLFPLDKIEEQLLPAGTGGLLEAGQ